MENQVKVNIWSDLYSKKAFDNKTLNFKINSNEVLRMANTHYDVIFNLLLEGKTIVVENIDLTSLSLKNALNIKEAENEKNNRVSIITSEHYTRQNDVLSNLINAKEKTYISFGLLEYFEDNHMIVKSAPLVFLPIKIEVIDDNTYQIKNINHEILLNNALIAHLNSKFRIDISYPIDNNFSLLEYLSFVSIKVRNNHFSVNNGSFITNYELDSFYIYQDYALNKNKLADLPLVKSISYLNSEFFNFNKTSSVRLNNNFLSLLNLDNDEYSILKLINTRENVIIKTNSAINKKHILGNIIHDFLLNKKNILLTYANEDHLKEIIDTVKSFQLEDFILLLDTESSNKEEIIYRLLHTDRLSFDIKLLDQTKIDETVDYYYLLKNNFKKVINSLRKNNEPINLSLNRAMFEYYNLSDVPLISSTISNAELIDETKLKSYLKEVDNFVKTLANLKCHYKDHPFYGFNRLDLTQNDYQSLKNTIIEFSTEFNSINDSFKNLNKAYEVPFPSTLKEMKCVLNILKLIPIIKDFNNNFFTLDIEKQETILSDLIKHNSEVETLIKQQNTLISLYGDKVFTIPFEEFHQLVIKKMINKKMIKTYSSYFMKKAKIDEAILINLDESLSEYYNLNKSVNSIINSYEDFKPYYVEGLYDIDKIKELFNLINSFNDNCKYLSQNNIIYTYENLEFFTDEIIQSLDKDILIVKSSFNKILDFTTKLQNYFDKSIIDFENLPLLVIEHKINQESKAFISINNYLDFYFSSRKLNKLIPSIADELLLYDDYNTYISIFMKRYYRDFINAIIKNNALLSNYNEDNYLLNIEKYQNYESIRNEIVKSIIKQNIKNEISKNTIVIKSVETPFLSSLSSSPLRALPLNELLSIAKTSIISTFPIIVAPVQEVSKLFIHPSYEFDLTIMIGDEKLQTSEVIPTLYRSKQTIVFDPKTLGNNDDKLIVSDDENFIHSSLNVFKNVNYVSSTYKETILTTNSIDTSLKTYLKEKLIKQNFIVSTDIVTDVGVIDLLVKVPSSTKSTAIFLDRLSYYSIESAIESYNITKSLVESLSLNYYRIITPFFFSNEEEEFEKLIKFITLNTTQEQEKKKIKVSKPLIDVLFSKYLNPFTVFNLIKDKKTKSNIDIMMEVLKQCHPISINELEEIFKDDTHAILSQLKIDKKINIANNFVFVNDQRINFKKVDKNDKPRVFDFVSNEEIAVGIQMILTQKSLSIDEMIKLILLSLGFKKMNHDQYFRIQNIIEDLIESKKIFIKDDILYEKF